MWPFKKEVPERTWYVETPNGGRLSGLTKKEAVTLRDRYGYDAYNVIPGFDEGEIGPYINNWRN